MELKLFIKGFIFVYFKSIISILYYEKLKYFNFFNNNTNFTLPNLLLSFLNLNHTINKKCLITVYKTLN